MSTRLVQLVVAELHRRGKHLGRVRMSDAEKIARTVVLYKVDVEVQVWYSQRSPDHAWAEFRRAWRELKEG